MLQKTLKKISDKNFTKKYDSNMFTKLQSFFLKKYGATTQFFVS